MSATDTTFGYMGIGTVLKKRRNKVGLSLAQVALKVGYSKRYIAKIEANTAPPKLATLRQLAVLYKLPIWVLMFFVNDEVEVEPPFAKPFQEMKGSLHEFLKEFI